VPIRANADANICALSVGFHHPNIGLAYPYSEPKPYYPIHAATDVFDGGTLATLATLAGLLLTTAASVAGATAGWRTEIIFLRTAMSNSVQCQPLAEARVIGCPRKA
jgi:hypothetical protein